MRATTQIGKTTFGIQGHVFAGRYAGNDFGLVQLVDGFEISNRLITRQNLTNDRLVFFCQLQHFLFYGN